MEIFRNWLHTVFSDTQLVILLLVLTIGTAALAGCGDDDSTPRDTGTRTILVTATVGEVSRSVAVDVDIR